MAGKRMTPEAVELLRKIHELREPPHSMTLSEIAAKLGVGRGCVAGLYYRNLSKKRFDRPMPVATTRAPSAPRRIGEHHESQ